MDKNYKLNLQKKENEAQYLTSYLACGAEISMYGKPSEDEKRMRTTQTYGEKEKARLKKLVAELRDLGYITLVKQNQYFGCDDYLTVYNMPMAKLEKFCYEHDIYYFDYYEVCGQNHDCAEGRSWKFNDDPWFFNSKFYGHYRSTYSSVLKKPEDKRYRNGTQTKCHGFNMSDAHTLSVWLEEYLRKEWSELTEEERLNRYTELLNDEDDKYVLERCNISNYIYDKVRSQKLERTNFVDAEEELDLERERDWSRLCCEYVGCYTDIPVRNTVCSEGEIPSDEEVAQAVEIQRMLRDRGYISMVYRKKKENEALRVAVMNMDRKTTADFCEEMGLTKFYYYAPAKNASLTGEQTWEIATDEKSDLDFYCGNFKLADMKYTYEDYDSDDVLYILGGEMLEDKKKADGFYLGLAMCVSFRIKKYMTKKWPNKKSKELIALYNRMLKLKANKVTIDDLNKNKNETVKDETPVEIPENWKEELQGITDDANAMFDGEEFWHYEPYQSENDENDENKDNEE